MRLLWLSVVAIAAWGQVPAQDSRNTNTPNTDTHFTMPVYSSITEWEARKIHLRRQILSAAGLLPLPEKTPLHPQVFGRIENKDYSIEKVSLETLPGFYLGGNLYRPLHRAGKLPAVLTPHGHWTYGRLEAQAGYSGQALGISLARQGYIAFAYDMVGYNDTVQTPHAFGGPAEQLWAFGPLGLQLWDSIRALDFLESLEDVDRERIAITGASGGATQAFLLTAVDERVKFSAPVNMVSAIMQGGSPCENAPGLRVGTNNMEIAAMFAPRPMLLVAATGDWTRNVPREEFPAVRRIYELYGKPDNIETVQFEAEHNYNQASREAVYRFFNKCILGITDEKQFSEKNVRLEKLQDMLVLHGRTLPQNALSYEGLFEQWKRSAKRQTDETRDRNIQRERLLYALGSEWPERVLSEVNGEMIVLSRAGKGDRVPGIWIPGNGVPVLFVHPGGAVAARESAMVQELIRSKRPVLLIDAFQTGAAVATRDRSHRWFSTFNRTEDANRVQDLLTALAFLKSRQSGSIELAGLGKAAVWALFAAAIAPTDVKLSADLNGFNGRDEEFIERFFVPGIQRAGGLEVARRLAVRSAAADTSR